MPISDIRFRRLGYVALNVTDLGRSAAFYTDIVGLAATTAPHGDVLLRCSDRRVDVMLTPAAEPGLKRIGWEMESAKALAAARARFTEIGLKPRNVPAAEAEAVGIGEAFRISEPTTGATFEFYADMAKADQAFSPGHTKIIRLGHVVLNTTDREATERFLREHMNFAVSDRIENTVSFMRCFPNPLHHTMGVGQSTGAGLNHVNFMVTDLDDIGRAHNRVKANGVPIVYGPGRHPPSDSVFLYFLDPDGMTIEYSFGMEEFAEVGAREPRMLAATLDSIDYWGGVPDPKFAKVGKIETLSEDVSA